ncbi:hypothetical protein BDZ89DRAFT_1063753 [Hymenopellis radicata]|nr:hypothetical protein BDZ89DRAFT_1063753 [Hymenopellis radicata]
MRSAPPTGSDIRLGAKEDGPDMVEWIPVSGEPSENVAAGNQGTRLLHILSQYRRQFKR